MLGPTEWGTRVAVEGVEWEIERPAGHPVMLPGPAVLLVRPEALRLGDDPQAIVGTVAGAAIHRAVVVLHRAHARAAPTLEVVAPPTAVREGERVGILPSRRAAGGLHLFPAEDG